MTMQCRTCGIEIADKALVCFRCGTATAAPPPAPPPPRSRRLVVPIIAAFAIIVIGALYMAMAVQGRTPPVVNWVLLGLAVVVVAWRFWSSRR